MLISRRNKLDKGYRRHMMSTAVRDLSMQVENHKAFIPTCITSSLEQTFRFTTSALS